MRNGAARLAAIGVIAIALIAVPSAQAADPFFGVFTTNLDRPFAQLESELDAHAATGVGLLREHVYWARIERAPGVFDFNGMSALVERATARGMTILPVLTMTPQFYSTRPAGLANDGWPPRDPSTMVRFTYELAKRYGTLGSYWGCVAPGVLCRRPYRPIRAWQVWNEPDLLAWWRTGVDPAAYTRLLRYAFLGLKLGDPNAEVVLGGLSIRALRPGGFLEQIYDHGAAPFFDTLALHPYAVSVGGVVTHIRRARGIAEAKNDGGVPLRVSEYGFATGGSRPWTTTPDCQAALLAATTRELAARRTELRLRGIIQLQWQDRPGPPNLWPNFAGLLYVDGSAKPALAAFTGAVAGRPPTPALSVAEVCPAQHQG